MDKLEKYKYSSIICSYIHTTITFTLGHKLICIKLQHKVTGSSKHIPLLHIVTVIH